MTSEIKAVITIVIVTALIIVVGLSLTKSNPQMTGIVVKADQLLASSTPQIVGTKDTDANRVSIVEFGDFACPACAALHPVLKPVLADFEGSVDFAFRVIPIHGEISIKSAIAAFAAGKQSKFWEMSDILFDKQNEWVLDTAKANEHFIAYAKAIGMQDQAAFEADLASADYRKTIEAILTEDAADARDMGISSTPTTIINKSVVVVGTQSYPALKKTISDQLQFNKTGVIATSTTPATAQTTSPVTGPTAAPAGPNPFQ